jgi:ribosomal 30S subunit maturation factor RimM
MSISTKKSMKDIRCSNLKIQKYQTQDSSPGDWYLSDIVHVKFHKTENGYTVKTSA